MYQILIADKSPLLGQLLYEWVDSNTFMEARAWCRTNWEVVCFVGLWRPDLVVMNLDGDDSGPLNSLQIISGEYPDTPVLALSSTLDLDLVAKAIAAGASGYLRGCESIPSRRQSRDPSPLNGRFAPSAPLISHRHMACSFFGACQRRVSRLQNS